MRLVKASEAAQSGSGKDKDGQPKRDPDAGWHVKKDSKGKLKSTYGYSVHTGVDEDGFIHRALSEARKYLSYDLLGSL